jgi:hypothetical protein
MGVREPAVTLITVRVAESSEITFVDLDWKLWQCAGKVDELINRMWRVGAVPPGLNLKARR